LNKKRPLFIVGSPRSGTTFLTRLLNQFLDIHVGRDAGSFLRLKLLLDKYGDLKERKNMERLIRDVFKDHFFYKRIIKRGLNITVDVALQEFEGENFAELMDYLMMQLAINHGKSRWGNKQPAYALHIAELHELFPEAKFLHIVRDGRDVALSMRKTRETAVERNWYYAAKDWEHHVLSARQAGTKLPFGTYMEINYEDLMKTPVQIFKKIIEFMGEPGENSERLMRFSKEIPNLIKPGNYDKWRRMMSPSAIRVIEQAVGKTLQLFGYTLLNKETVGKPFSVSQRIYFFLDNVAGKVFSPAAKKYVVYRYQFLKSKIRAWM